MLRLSQLLSSAVGVVAVDEVGVNDGIKLGSKVFRFDAIQALPLSQKLICWHKCSLQTFAMLKGFERVRLAVHAANSLNVSRQSR